MRVHDVERHLHRVEMGFVRGCSFEHLQVNVRTLVPREPDVTHLPCLLRLQNRLHASVRRENPLRVGRPNDFMELEKVDVVGLQASQRIIKL